MNIEQTVEAIKVMQGFVDGKELESMYDGKWGPATAPRWNWDNTEYRIKPTATLRDFPPHDRQMVCEGKELERLASVRLSYIKQLESEKDEANDRIKRLEREVKTLRLYGNKDCTAQADEVLKEQAKPGESTIECLTSSTATKIDVALLDKEAE